MTPIEFITYAARVAASPTSGTAGYRSSVSRAYYGAFHLARQLLENDLEIDCRAAGNEHALIQQFFLNCSVKKGVAVGMLLRNLHTSRKEADYMLETNHSETQVAAMLSVERATELARMLDEIKEGPLRALIQAGIVQYRSITRR